ncbi:MAG: hypothetical protein M3N29_04285 [Chloroflexota bacterium]|nr:hypothetical protein [Chloroflexota bacterium]
MSYPSKRAGHPRCAPLAGCGCAPNRAADHRRCSRRRYRSPWSGSSDNIAVAGYRIYRNNSQVATVTTTSYSFKKTNGTSTYYVVAFDAAGNTSPASNTVTATVR